MAARSLNSRVSPPASIPQQWVKIPVAVLSHPDPVWRGQIVALYQWGNRQRWQAGALSERAVCALCGCGPSRARTLVRWLVERGLCVVVDRGSPTRPRTLRILDPSRPAAPPPPPPDLSAPPPLTFSGSPPTWQWEEFRSGSRSGSAVLTAALLIDPAVDPAEGDSG